MGKSVLELGVNTGQWDAGLKKAGSALNNFVQANGGLQQALQKDDKSIASFVQMMGKMESTATTAKGRMNDYKRTIEQLTEQFNHLTAAQKASVGAQYTASIDQITQKYKAAAAEVQKLNASLMTTGAAKGFGASLSAGVGSAISMFGPQMMAIAGVTAAISGMKSVVSDVVNINRQFEQSTANLASVIGGTRDQISALTQQAKQLGATTQYTAMQITDLQTNLARLGFNQQEILNSTKAVQALATATGADLGEAANLAGAALRGFGMDAAEMERVASVLAVSTTKSALSFEKLATALPTVAPVAKQFGFSIEDIVTLLGKLSDAGLDASTAGTATRKILLNLADSSGKLAQALGRPVHNVEELSAALVELKDKGLDLNKMLDLTDVRSVTAFATFVDNAKTLTDLKNSITDCSDALDTMVNERLNTLEGSATIMKSAWEGLMLTFSNSNGILKQTTDALTRLLTAWTNWRNRSGAGGKEGAIRAYQSGMSDADKANAESIVAGYRAGGTTDAEIRAIAEKRIQTLEEEKAKLDKALVDFERSYHGRNQMVRQQKQQEAYRQMAAVQDKIDYQNYIISLATPAAATEAPTANATSSAEAGPAKGTIAWQEQEVKRLTEAWKNAGDAVRDDYKKQLDAAQDVLDRMLGKTEKVAEPKTYDVTFAGPDNPFEMLQLSIRTKLADQAALVDENTIRSLMTVAIQHGIESANPDFASLQAKMAEGMDIPDEVWTKLEEQINAELKKLNLDPIKLNISTGAVKTAENEAKSLEFGWVKAAQAVEQVGSAIQSIEDPSAKIAGIIASAIANVAAGLGGILASQEAMANPWNWVALALSGTATMISTVSAIKSATAGSYANGGVIPGTHYSGDMQLAAVNAGETILSVAQTGVVADALKNSPLENIRLEAIISGRDLRLVLANNDRFFGGSRGDYVVATSRS